jgi:hypothetical protein
LSAQIFIALYCYRSSCDFSFYLLIFVFPGIDKNRIFCHNTPE